MSEELADTVIIVSIMVYVYIIWRLLLAWAL